MAFVRGILTVGCWSVMSAGVLTTRVAAAASGNTVAKHTHTADSPRIGLLLALYNANVTTDWVRVAAAAHRIPIRAILPVKGVSPPDPSWPPDYPSDEVDVVHAAGNFDGILLDNMDTTWSSPGYNNPSDAFSRMYEPAAAIVRRKGLNVWSNGPHVASNGSVEANASTWRPYLELANFTSIFEISVTNWLEYPPTNFSERLDWPSSKLGGVVLNVPNNATASLPAVKASLEVAIKSGLQWLYPSIPCKHGTGPHRGSCTYADLPAYWDGMVSTIEDMNHGI